MKAAVVCLVLLILTGHFGNAASKTWTGIISTSWGNISNWTPSGVPANGDDVTIPSNAVRMPTYSGGTLSLNSLTVNGTLTISGGQITVATNSSIVNLNLQGGVLGGNVNYTLTNTLNWTGGTIGGTGTFTISGSATCNISGGNPKILNTRTLSNQGEINWSGSGNLSALNNPTLTNGINGVINIQSEADWVGAGTINNQALITQALQLRGHINKSGGTTTTLDAVVNNNGQITCQSNTALSFDGGGTGGSNSIFNCNGGFVFPEGSVFTFNTGALIQGTGQIHASGGTLQCNGTYNMTSPNSVIATAVTAGGIINFNPSATLQSLGHWVRVSIGTLNLSSGETSTSQRLDLITGGNLLTGSDRMIVTQQMNWDVGQIAGSGVLELRPTCQTNLSSANLKQLGDTRVVDHFGDLLWTGTGNVQCSGSPVFNNLPGAEFTIQTNADWLGSGTFNNVGDIIEGQFGTVLRMSTASIEATIFEVAFNNDGRVETQPDAPLHLRGGGTNHGAFLINGNLTFGAGTHTLNATSSVNGTGQIQVLGSTVNCNGLYNMNTPVTSIATAVSVAGTLHFNPSANLQNLGRFVSITGSGVLNLSSGETVNVQHLRLFENGTLAGSDTVNISTLLDWQGGSMGGTGTTRCLNGSTLTISTNTQKQLKDSRFLKKEGNGSWNGLGNVICGPNTRFENSNNFNMISEADWTSGSLFNLGQMIHNAAGEKIVSGTFLNRGSLSIQANGAILRFNNTFHQDTANGAVFVNRGTTLSSTMPLLILNGFVSTGSNGTATIVGTLNNSGGRFDPGGLANTGIVRLEGDYGQGAPGELFIDLGGIDNSNPVDPEFDQIIIPGNNRAIQLAGTLSLRHNSFYQPTLCDEVKIIEFTGDTNIQINGTFQQVDVVGFNSFGLTPVVVYEPRAIRVQMVSTIMGDVNADGCVNDEDLLAILFNFGGSGCPYDLNHDGQVDDFDMLYVVFNFGIGC
ncbi:MAG: hypothetical protein KIT45_04145 [Fimbriimonadia bacterium]|nr:hypothetical protein [Fimbriimonadia bacterium]